MNDRRLRGAVLLLSLAGAGVAAYLTFAHFADSPIACTIGGCEKVQTSRYAEVAGVPVATIGLAGYLVLAWTALARSALARSLGLAAAVIGFVVSMVLLYVQAGILHAFCQWCLASDAILVLLLPATLLRAWRGAPPGAGSSHRARRPGARARPRREARARPRRSAG